MSKAKLNTNNILNELTGKSRFFEKSNPPIKTIKKVKPASSNHDTVIPCNHDTTMVEEIRKATKAFGKEAATHRFTGEEKQAIAEIVYQCKQENIRTSENEIVRIAINWMIRDHKHNNNSSILDKVLNALHR
jgi:hypothetical protein